LFAAFALFWSWEGLAAARSQSRRGKRTWRNLAVSLLVIMVAAFTGIGLAALSTTVAPLNWGLAGASFLPAWAVVLLGVLPSGYHRLLASPDQPSHCGPVAAASPPPQRRRGRCDHYVPQSPVRVRGAPRVHRSGGRCTRHSGPSRFAPADPSTPDP